jgi:hypothetical protein
MIEACVQLIICSTEPRRDLVAQYTLADEWGTLKRYHRSLSAPLNDM